MHRFVLLLVLICGVARGYDFLTSPPLRWAPGEIPMVLQLNDTLAPRPLRDGKNSWNQVAVEAFAIWNGQLREVQFTEANHFGRGDGNRRNEVFFSSHVYGRRFGADVLAITTAWRIRTQRVEADTIFNRAIPWDSYRGELDADIVDLQRVAIHEFGHTLGLDHPDEARQAVISAMNGFVSDLDTLAEDDIRGAQALYFAPGTRYQLNVSAFPPEAGVVLVRPFSADGTYAAGSIVTLTARPNRHFRFNFWDDEWAKSSRVLKLRIDGHESITARFVTNTAPRILVPPRSQLASSGDIVVLRARATGAKPLSYQWWFDDSPITGANEPILVLPGVTHSDSGLYSIVVSNPKGQTMSKPARLIVDGY